MYKKSHQNSDRILLHSRHTDQTWMFDWVLHTAPSTIQFLSHSKNSSVIENQLTRFVQRNVAVRSSWTGEKRQVGNYRSRLLSKFEQGYLKLWKITLLRMFSKQVSNTYLKQNIQNQNIISKKNICNSIWPLSQLSYLMWSSVWVLKYVSIKRAMIVK